jgi:hypothetical protein
MDGTCPVLRLIVHYSKIVISLAHKARSTEGCSGLRLVSVRSIAECLPGTFHERDRVHDIFRTIGAIEVMLFVLFALRVRQFPEQIHFGGLKAHCFNMVHFGRSI